jgi:hypothetical protein
VLRVLYLLQITSQIPPEKQIVETGKKWPIKLYRRKTPFDMIKAFEEVKKEDIKVSSCNFSNLLILFACCFSQEWNLLEFERLLISNYTCVWGTCYNESKSSITEELIEKKEETS